ncbi:helix-turn-helix domain-containing protein [Halococcus thailandensis]|uniref:Response regulator receiver protein n=1 Tax=Halococcus thailandensis JCM 13552 TaxID=1227457 RepID=M0ND50_9EURY|nr:helix-turn-helix domain-containing protein [Halococcus thailandensis]EMA55791.1 response regulator receiver protein [Halococcus thailandensis JCM 13552]
MCPESTPTNERSNGTGDIQVLLIDDDETWARTQRRVLERQSDRLDVETAHSLTETRQSLASTTPDCLVCDYQLGDGTALELLPEVRESHPELPFILVTGRGSEATASEAISNDVTEYVRKSTLRERSALLGRRIESVVDSVRTERALAHERRSKEALLEMITTSVTREELAGDICRHLVDERQYACSWIGVHDSEGAIVPLASAGETGYVTQVLDGDTEISGSSEPALVSFDENTSVLVSSYEDASATDTPDAAGLEAVSNRTNDGNIDSENDRAQWERLASKHGFHSIGAVPIEHDQIRFGVLAVYATDSRQVDEREIAFISEYADTIGYALQATNWRETLLTSDTAHVEFTIGDREIPLVALSRALSDSTTLEMTTVIPRNETEVLCVVSTSDSSKEELLDAVSTVDAIRSIDVYKTNDPLRCGVIIEKPIPELTVAEHGAHFERTSIVDGQANILIHLGENTSAKRIETGLGDGYRNVSMTMVQTNPSEEASERGNDHTPLTDRQQQVLKLAFQLGYFERPRGKNAEEIATMLDISRSTFTQHLRAAQRKILEGTNEVK